MNCVREPDRSKRNKIHGLHGLVILALLVAGCGKPTQPPKADASISVPPKGDPVAVAAEPPKALQKQDPPKTDPKLEALKVKVGEFLSETRAGLKLLELGPNLATAREKSKAITELYIHLPDIPPGLDPDGLIAGRLKNINGDFALAVEYVRLIDQAAGLGSQKLIDDTDKAAANVRAEIRAFSKEIETKLGLTN